MISNKQDFNLLADHKMTLASQGKMNTHLNQLKRWDADAFFYTRKDEPVYSNYTMSDDLVIDIYKL